MLGLFLRDDAVDVLQKHPGGGLERHYALEVIEKGYTVIRGSLAPSLCRDVIAAFRAFELRNLEIFAANRDAAGHYMRIVNLHDVLPELAHLFTRNRSLLATLDMLFGARASLYTTLFYEVGSQQPLHRDTPVFSTRPEYLYFGVSVYLEPADDGNGCLQVMEHGHRIPELDREAMALRRYGSLEKIPNLDNDIWMEYQNSVVAIGRAAGLPIRKLPVNEGDTIIWHPQLPHGGSVIHDAARSRFSLVMHVTPEAVPVYHQNVFFAPSREFPQTPRWGYYDIDGRKIADQRSGVSFGHKRDYRLDEFCTDQSA
jgi:ectoine hydroxylase-related dioxygenase (phytanoyl-CoA dioxygenase family)